MKTRIIQTSFWKDCKVQEMSLYAQHLFIYLLTSDHIGLTGAFELPDSYILLESKLTEHQLNQAKEELTKNNRVVFDSGWVVIRNAGKYNNYLNSPKTIKAYEREYNCIPSKLLVHLDSTIDSSIDTIPIVTINHKTKTIKQKTENIKELSPRVKWVMEELNNSFNPTKRTVEIIEKDFGAYKITDEVKKYATNCEDRGKTPSTSGLQNWLINAKKWGNLEKRDK
mgnify:CR=1 FL=1